MSAIAETCAAFVAESADGLTLLPGGPTAVLSSLQELGGTPALVLGVAELVHFAVYLASKGVKGTDALLDAAVRFTAALRALGGHGSALADELEARGGELSRFTGEARRDAPLPAPLASVKSSPLARFTLDVATRKKD